MNAPCINAYLVFNGNCREAMEFYKACLGGELTLQTIGESPMAGQMPQQMKDCILHATLTHGNIVLMASDLVGNKGFIKGTTMSLMLDCSTEADLRQYFESLSEGGTLGHAIETTFWGALLGDFTDKYGNQWILHFEQKQ